MGQPPSGWTVSRDRPMPGRVVLKELRVERAARSCGRSADVLEDGSSSSCASRSRASRPRVERHVAVRHVAAHREERQRRRGGRRPFRRTTARSRADVARAAEPQPSLRETPDELPRADRALRAGSSPRSSQLTSLRDSRRPGCRARGPGPPSSRSLIADRARDHRPVARVDRCAAGARRPPARASRGRT